MITVAAIIPIALVAGSLIGVLLKARLASGRRRAELRGPQVDELLQSAFQALRELRIRSELAAKLNDDVDRTHGADTLDYTQQRPDVGGITRAFPWR
jgi:hypothetical protein